MKPRLHTHHDGEPCVCENAYWAAEEVMRRDEEVTFRRPDWQQAAVVMVLAERARQDRLHPDFPITPAERLVIGTEELGEVARAIQDGNADDELREWVHVAAVALRAVEALL